ncbi:MAG: calcium-binding protein [Xenococcaceae cyanobacterium]
MRILLTIAHFFDSNADGRHASERKNPKPRLIALTTSIAALHQLFGKSQRVIDHHRHLALSANQDRTSEIDLIVCTTKNYHLLDLLPLPKHFYQHHSTKAEPLLLGFECQAVMRDRLGKYDYYCFLEDDIILHDPWFFVKLNWFTQQTGNLCLLQPNRYEISSQNSVCKAYIDGELAPKITAPFQNVRERPLLKGEIMGMPVTFQRTLNPHAGCYFLNAYQMQHWVEQSYFLDRDTSFVSALESAATLGIMKTFRVYKSASEQANFLEVQHFGNRFLRLIGNKVIDCV